MRNGNLGAVNLERMARSIARAYGDKGAVVISVGEDGYRVGVANLTDRELQDALCVGIHHNLIRLDNADQS